MEPVQKKLIQIAEWYQRVPDPLSLKTDDEFMTVGMDLMSNTRLLLRISVALVPDDAIASKGYSKHKAIVMGHMVRLSKLYDGFCLHVAERQAELAGIFMRLIHECDVKIQYLLKAKRSTFKNFVLSSHRSDKQMLLDLREKGKRRKLIPIERRIKSSIMRRLRRDGVTAKDLIANNNWKLDGKGFLELMKSLNRENEYSYSFGSSSRFVHGSWDEICHYHLTKEKGRYMPDMRYGDPDPRMVFPITGISLDTISRYLEWSKGDPDGSVQLLTTNILGLCMQMDAAHEKRIST